MAITLKRLEGIARDELGASPGLTQSTRELSGTAGRLLMNSRQWLWSEGRSVTLRPRASISIVDGTWTDATRTLTKVGAWANYSFLSGDTINILDGTGASPGVYEIESKTSSDAIVLRTSIGAAADGQTDIDGEQPNDQVALPGDFDFLGITAHWVPNSLTSTLELISPSTMLELRGISGVVTTVGFWALLRYVRSLSGGQAVARLELWPTTTSEEDALVIFYRAGWRDPATDEEVFSIPPWLEPLYLEIFKAVVLGNEEPEKGTVDQRFTAACSGKMFADAVHIDSTHQWDYGVRRWGWLEMEPSWPDYRWIFEQPLTVGP